MQFCSISRKRVYNDALQDQSSSHLSAVLEIPDRYSTTHRSCFVPRLFVCVCALCPVCTCTPLPLPHFLQIFTLDFLIFAEAMMREPRVSRDDYSK